METSETLDEQELASQPVSQDSVLNFSDILDESMCGSQLQFYHDVDTEDLLKQSSQPSVKIQSQTQDTVDTMSPVKNINIKIDAQAKRLESLKYQPPGINVFRFDQGFRKFCYRELDLGVHFQYNLSSVLFNSKRSDSVNKSRICSDPLYLTDMLSPVNPNSAFITGQTDYEKICTYLFYSLSTMNPNDGHSFEYAEKAFFDLLKNYEYVWKLSVNMITDILSNYKMDINLLFPYRIQNKFEQKGGAKKSETFAEDSSPYRKLSNNRKVSDFMDVDEAARDSFAAGSNKATDKPAPNPQTDAKEVGTSNTKVKHSVIQKSSGNEYSVVVVSSDEENSNNSLGAMITNNCHSLNLRDNGGSGERPIVLETDQEISAITVSSSETVEDNRVIVVSSDETVEVDKAETVGIGEATENCSVVVVSSDENVDVAKCAEAMSPKKVLATRDTNRMEQEWNISPMKQAGKNMHSTPLSSTTGKLKRQAKMEGEALFSHGKSEISTSSFVTVDTTLRQRDATSFYSTPEEVSCVEMEDCDKHNCAETSRQLDRDKEQPNDSSGSVLTVKSLADQHNSAPGDHTQSAKEEERQDFVFTVPDNSLRKSPKKSCNLSKTEKRGHERVQAIHQPDSQEDYVRITKAEAGWSGSWLAAPHLHLCFKSLKEKSCVPVPPATLVNTMAIIRKLMSIGLFTVKSKDEVKSLFLTLLVVAQDRNFTSDRCLETLVKDLLTLLTDQFTFLQDSKEMRSLASMIILQFCPARMSQHSVTWKPDHIPKLMMKRGLNHPCNLVYLVNLIPGELSSLANLKAIMAFISLQLVLDCRNIVIPDNVLVSSVLNLLTQNLENWIKLLDNPPIMKASLDLLEAAVLSQNPLDRVEHSIKDISYRMLLSTLKSLLQRTSSEETGDTKRDADRAKIRVYITKTMRRLTALSEKEVSTFHK